MAIDRFRGSMAEYLGKLKADKAIEALKVLTEARESLQGGLLPRPQQLLETSECAKKLVGQVIRADNVISEVEEFTGRITKRLNEVGIELPGTAILYPEATRKTTDPTRKRELGILKAGLGDTKLFNHLTEEVKERTLNSIGLPTRNWYSLKRAGVHNIREVIELTEDDLLGVRSFGPASLNELLNRLLDHGVYPADIEE